MGSAYSVICKKVGSSCRNHGTSEMELGCHPTECISMLGYVPMLPRCSEGILHSIQLPVVGLGSHSLKAGFDFSPFFIFICIISVSLDDLVEAMLLSRYEKLYDNDDAEAPVLWPTDAKG